MELIILKTFEKNRIGTPNLPLFRSQIPTWAPKSIVSSEDQQLGAVHKRRHMLGERGSATRDTPCCRYMKSQDDGSQKCGKKHRTSFEGKKSSNGGELYLQHQPSMGYLMSIDVMGHALKNVIFNEGDGYLYGTKSFNFLNN